MPEFDALRIACLLTELWLIARRPGRWITALLAVSAVWHAIPAHVFNGWWLRAVQTPLLAVLLALSIVVSLDLFGWYEQRGYLLVAALAAGAMPAVAGWMWHPENWYQAMMLLRQYAVLGLAAGVGVAWAWVRHLEPTDAPQRAPLGLWLVWLLADIPDAISTKGGLLWAVFEWHDGMPYWRAANALTLAARLVVLVVWAVSLRRRPAASQDPQASAHATLAS